jgi:CelD/BcsL family acetyltransferase involved in cellulose biosynthesis
LREANTTADINAYHNVYMQLFRETGRLASTYPVELFFALTSIPDNVRLLVAEYESKIVAGGLFFRDGCSVMYWHGAADRQYSRYFPSCAVIDEAVQWACATRATIFNFGGSGGIRSLEKFKEYWGATSRLNWEFRWSHPLWRQVSGLRERLRSLHA